MAAVAGHCTVSLAEVQRLFVAVAHELNIGALDAAGLHNLYQQQAGFQGDLEAFLIAFGSGLSRLEEPLAYAMALQQRTNVSVGIISNTNEAHVAWLDENVPELEHFDLVVMSNEVSLAKPAAEIYALALELLEVAPAATIFVDDRQENVAAAQALGIAGLIQQDWALTQATLEEWLATGIS